MINQTPPHTMTSKERHAEIAEIMARGISRLKSKADEKNMNLGEYLTGLRRKNERSCDHKKQR